MVPAQLPGQQKLACLQCVGACLSLSGGRNCPAGCMAWLLAGNPEIMGGAGEGDDAVRGKVSMKKLFGRKNLKKDGTEGKVGVSGLWVGSGLPGGCGVHCGGCVAHGVVRSWGLAGDCAEEVGLLRCTTGAWRQNARPRLHVHSGVVSWRRTCLPSGARRTRLPSK